MHCKSSSEQPCPVCDAILLHQELRAHLGEHIQQIALLLYQGLTIIVMMTKMVKMMKRKRIGKAMKIQKMIMIMKMKTKTRRRGQKIESSWEIFCLFPRERSHSSNGISYTKLQPLYLQPEANKCIHTSITDHSTTS
jgi:hypothetical protein